MDSVKFSGFQGFLLDGFMEGSVFNNQGWNRHSNPEDIDSYVLQLFIQRPFWPLLLFVGKPFGYKKTALKCISRLWFHDGWMHACTVDRLDD